MNAILALGMLHGHPQRGHRPVRRLDRGPLRRRRRLPPPGRPRPLHGAGRATRRCGSSSSSRCCVGHARRVAQRVPHRPAAASRRSSRPSACCTSPAASRCSSPTARPSPSSSGSPKLGNTGLHHGPRAVRPSASRCPVWMMVVFAVVFSVVLTRTPFGRWLYATGGNEPRRRALRGADQARSQTRIYVIAGLCAAIVGLLLTADLPAAAPRAGELYELNAIAAVVIGGAALVGWPRHRPRAPSSAPSSSASSSTGSSSSGSPSSGSRSSRAPSSSSPSPSTRASSRLQSTGRRASRAASRHPGFRRGSSPSRHRLRHEPDLHAR